MAVQKGLYGKIVFFVLYGFAIINHGISQNADYTAEVKIEELQATPDSGYFEVQGKLPKLTLFVNQEIQTIKQFYVVDYYFGKDGKKNMIGKSLLCDEVTKKSSSELRSKIVSTFLFPIQQHCTIKQDKVREPTSKTLSFNYDASEVSCKEPWKYSQEIISLDNTKKPLLTLTVNLKMEKKGQCAS